MKKTKKINPKEIFKNEVRDVILSALENVYTVDTDFEDYGMTKGTLIVKGNEFDVQIKFITPKAGVDHYEKMEDE